MSWEASNLSSRLDILWRAEKIKNAKKGKRSVGNTTILSLTLVSNKQYVIQRISLHQSVSFH